MKQKHRRRAALLSAVLAAGLLCMAPAAETLPGDVNGDGVFDAADVTALQDWLLVRPGAALADWRAGDLCADGRLNAADLTVMQRSLAAAPVVYHTEPDGGPVVNPHKGYMMTTYSPHMFSEKYKYGIGGELDNRAWELVRVCAGAHYWKDINPAEGVYQWDEVDAMLETCAAHGMTYVIRIIPYSTSIGSDENLGKAHDLVPEYLYEKGLPHTDATLRWDSSIHVQVPDWSSPVYIQGCKELASAMAERYDGDPRVECIDVRSFGNWGEWHTAQITGSQMPADEILTDMLDHYAAVFPHTQLAVPSDAKGDVYKHALQLGITKRNDGLIAIPGRDTDLIPAYEANLPTIAEYPSSYESMLQNTDIIPGGYLRWTPERFRSAIEAAHMTMMALDQASDCGWKICSEQRAVLEEMVTRMGYNFTVTSAVRRGSTLTVTVENTGLAPAFFDIDLAAELCTAGETPVPLGEPVRIPAGSFRDGTAQTFTFTGSGSGSLPPDAVLCLAMYEPANTLAAGQPTVRFDNAGTRADNRLPLR